MKYPEPGKVKTRLAKDIGAEAAASLYRQASEKNLTVLAGVGGPFRLIVAFDPPENETEIKKWLNRFPVTDFLPQKGVELGERLEHAFHFAFRGDAGAFRKLRVMALGSDTLGLTHEIICKGFCALDSHDCVIGPTRDGGYYLIGLSFEERDIFRNIPWSTSEVYSRTVQYLNKAQLSYCRLPLLEDLDGIENLTGGVLK
ncbi:MAG TPA: TIGR04282 family arsenosugar biosynthesis glycosyltransferase [bacterium]|nr:TIGR04282 family arsenosugar biosynthesis glycosyltransferase [bacterium]